MLGMTIVSELVRELRAGVCGLSCPDWGNVMVVGWVDGVGEKG